MESSNQASIYTMLMSNDKNTDISNNESLWNLNTMHFWWIQKAFLNVKIFRDIIANTDLSPPTPVH